MLLVLWSYSSLKEAMMYTCIDVDRVVGFALVEHGGTGPHRRWPSIANRSAKAIATTISCTIFHSINSRKCTTKNITVLATARTAPRRERVL